MKKLFVIFLLFASVGFGQKDSSDKGNISLIFNKTQISLPVTSIFLRKDNNLTISATAEDNSGENQKSVTIELRFENRTSLDKKQPKQISLRISSRNRYQNSGEDLSINYPPESKKGQINYSVYNNGERVNWSFSSFQMNFDIENISYSNCKLKITGSFSAEYKSSLKQNDVNNSIELKDGKFEINI